jgi:2-polyprenyl-3-methyl-5-hydroxy-6-metoxy-1,4-benzoquinol methylase
VTTASLGRDYFEDRYAREADPWRFATSHYEHEKYDATLSALPRARYARGLEIGCSIGVLTRRLATRCDRLLATDVAERPLREARLRSADAPWVEFSRSAAPAEWPEGTFDLILLSEVVYYLNRADVDLLSERIVGSLIPQGDLVLVHWTGKTDYPLSGDEASERLLEKTRPALRTTLQKRLELFRLDVARRR